MTVSGSKKKLSLSLSIAVKTFTTTYIIANWCRFKSRQKLLIRSCKEAMQQDHETYVILHGYPLVFEIMHGETPTSESWKYRHMTLTVLVRLKHQQSKEKTMYIILSVRSKKTEDFLLICYNIFQTLLGTVKPNNCLNLAALYSCL